MTLALKWLGYLPSPILVRDGATKPLLTESNLIWCADSLRHVLNENIEISSKLGIMLRGEMSSKLCLC